MQNHLFKLGALCAIMLAAGCKTMNQPISETPPPKNPDFAAEMYKFNSQFPNEKATKYEDVSIRFNNDQKFDQRGNCHDKSRYPVTIILQLDASGKVTHSMTDVENNKAECFRQTYASVQFPAPPMAPYRKAILLQ